MKLKILAVLLLLIMTAYSGISKNRDNGLHIKYLRCENLVNPSGIDVLLPRLSWYSESLQRDQKQTAYNIIVSSSIKNLNADNGDLWDSKKVISDQSMNIIYGGKNFSSGMDCFWKVKIWDDKDNESNWSLPAKWSMGLLNKSDWKAEWIGLDKIFPGDDTSSFLSKLTARYFRKSFAIDKNIKKATAYICGLGTYVLYINGKRVGDQVLSPTVTDYSKRDYYNTLDVTKLIYKKENVIGVILGNGRFFSPRPTKFPSWYAITNYGFPKMLLQLEIEMNDGSKQIIVSDNSWKVTADGPIRVNNEYDGELYDAKKEMLGWNKTGFKDSDWLPVQLVMPPSTKIEAQPNPNIKIMDILHPVSIHEIKSGTYIVDMGQNMVGWAQMMVKGTKGTTVKLKYAEKLNEDGSLYTANLRTAEAADTYIFNSKREVTWEPNFTYHGFRYIEVTGLNYKPGLNSITGKVVYDQMATLGQIKTSDSMLNSIYKAAYWTIRGNYRGMPTDCPQRDERMGWLGDRSMNSYGESFIFDNDMLYSKWMVDISDAQTDSGRIPNVAPDYWPVFNDNMTWPSSIIIIPNNLYHQFGNIKVIADNYNTMKNWLSYMQNKYMNNYLLPMDTYGDWCMPPENPKLIHSEDPKRQTPGDYIGSAYLYYCLNLMKEYAVLLNKENDVDEYSTMAEKVRVAVNNTYLNKDSLYYANNTVTANTLALSFKIPPDEIRSKVFDNLVYITTHDYNSHTSTGLVGGQWIMRTLTDNGRPDLAFKLATNKDYPSWGYMIENKATTIWELWNGNTADPAMNSGNHVMLLGDLIVWYYEDLAGIKSDPSKPAYKHIIMKPVPVGDLSFIKASYQSMYGLVKSEWHYKNDKFNWDINIPVNTTATVYIPAEKEGDVTEGGKEITMAAGIKFVKSEDGRAVFEIGSGSYHFISKNCKIKLDEKK
jgi:alpha-L-rhamnosidase